MDASLRRGLRARGLTQRALFALLLALSCSPASAQEPAPGSKGPRQPAPSEDAGLASEVGIARLELRAGARVEDTLRLLGEASGINFVVTPEAAEVRLSAAVLREVSVREALEGICKSHDLWYRPDGKLVRVMTTEEYSKDLTIVREPVTRVFSLLNPNVLNIATAIRSLFAPRVNLSLGIDAPIGGGLAGGGGLGGGGFGNASGLGGGNRYGGIQNNFGGGGFGGGGFGGGGFGGGGFGGGGFGAGGYGGGYGGGNLGGQRNPDEATIDTRRLTADRLARLVESRAGTGEVTGDAEGLVDGKPIIQVSVNQRHNLIVVRTADREALREIERLIVQLDRPLSQVLLEVKVLEVRLGDGFESALEVEWVDDRDPFDPSRVATSALSALGSPAVGGGSLVYQLLNEHVQARISLLGRESRLSTLATPLLLCANGETSQIFIGEERPLVRGIDVQTTTNQTIQTQTASQDVELRAIGNTLSLIPRINADRTVSLTLVQDISSVNKAGAELPVVGSDGTISTFPIDTVSTANLVGTVIARDGLTLAVGGLIRKEKSDSQQGIPWLQELPLVGWLFGSTVRNEERRELILLVTPHVLSTPAEGAARTRARMRALSLHPWHDMGERALQRYDRDDVPGSEGYRYLIEDYLLPIPDPTK